MFRLILIVLLSLVALKALEEHQKMYKLFYAKQTNKNIIKFKKLLEQLTQKNDIEALKLFALTYEKGSHWRKDSKKAIEYYKKASILGDAESKEKLGRIYYNKNDLNNAYYWFEKVFLDKSESLSLLYLIEISKKQNKILLLEKYLQYAKKLKLKDDLYGRPFVFQENDSIEIIKRKAIKIVKMYNKETVRKYTRLKPLFRSLGFNVDSYIIHNGSVPIVEIILKKNKNIIVDKKMVKVLSSGNETRQILAETIFLVLDIEKEVKAESNVSLTGIDIEMGATISISLIFGEVD